jgi:hypothetical protein
MDQTPSSCLAGHRLALGMTSTSTINVFQRLARQWDEIHPYNAAQILKLSGTPDLTALQDAWHDAMNDLGLGRVRSGDRHSTFFYECLNGEMTHYGVKPVPAGTSLEDYVSEQLNRRFDNSSEPPFRPFVLAENGHYYAGVIYHHWVADSVSIRTLLREWFIRLFDPSQARKTPVKLAEAGYRKFLMFEGPAAMGRGLLSATRWASSLRRAQRVEIRGRCDLSVRLAIRSAAPGTIDQLCQAARSRRVTVNDLFLASIAQVCERHVPLKRRPRRQSIALGAIVDLRPYLNGQLEDAFGLFLGFTNIVCRPHELRDPERLAQAIGAQSRKQKRFGIPQMSALRMMAGVTAGRMYEPKDRALFYQKHVPIAGGISNVNLNRCWATRYFPTPLLDYIRVSPTGPMMPLVFATTTLGRSLHFALTYRPSIVPPSQVDGVAKTFLDCLAAYTS